MMVKDELTVGAIATMTRSEVRGDSEVKISGVKPLELASKSDLTFFAPTSKKMSAELFERAKRTGAGAVVVAEYNSEISTTQIISTNPLRTVIEVAAHLRPAIGPAPGIHPQASVDPTAQIGNDVSIGAFAVIGAGCSIGDRAIIHPHTVIYPGAILGADCVIHAGAVIREFVQLGNDCLIQPGVVIGGDGFGYIPDKEIGHRRIPHVGTVILGDRVDLGANATIDRATLGETKVGANTKFDNLVMVGHNCQIGSSSLFCSQVGISGSTNIGSNVILAGQVGVADHVTVGNGVRAVGKTGITTDIPDGVEIGGFPARKATEWRREMLLLSKLSGMSRAIRRINRVLKLDADEE